MTVRDLAFVLLIAPGMFHARSVSAAAPDEDTVRKAAHEFVGCFRLKNTTPLSRLDRTLAEDFIQATSRGQVVRGREANTAVYREAVDEIRAAFSEFDTRYDIEVVRVFKDSAFVFGKLTMAGRLKNGNAPYRRVIWESLIFERGETGWRMLHEHSTEANTDDR